MNEMKILSDSIGLKIFDWEEWKLQYIPNVVTVMYGADFKTIAPAIATTSLWPHTWTDDISTSRTPRLVFEFIYSNQSTRQLTSWYGLYDLSLLFWIELVIIQLLVCLLAALPISVLMYYIIIVPQKPENNFATTVTKQQTGDEIKRKAC